MSQKASFIPFAGGSPPASDPLRMSDTFPEKPPMPAPRDPPAKVQPPQPVVSFSLPTIELHIELLREAIGVMRDAAPDRSPRRLRTVTKLRALVAELKTLILAAQEAAGVEGCMTEQAKPTLSDEHCTIISEQR